MLWEAPIGVEWEQVVVEHIAIKYSITTEHVNKINMKISYYDLVQDFGSTKPVETMTWTEFNSVIRKYGNPFPKDCE